MHNFRLRLQFVRGTRVNDGAFLHQKNPRTQLERGFDIDQAGLAILYALHAEKGSLRVTDLAERLGIDAPAVTRKAQRLERLGLVSRARCVDDARVCRLRLSAEGQEAISRFLLARHQWLSTLLAGWSPEDQRDFARLIGRFASDIHRHLDELHV